MERSRAAVALRLLRTSTTPLTTTEGEALDLAVAMFEASPSPWPKLEAPARVGNFMFGEGLSAHYVVEAAKREHLRHTAAGRQTVEQYRQAELDRRDAWDMLNGALVNGMAQNARRYLTWRAGMLEGLAGEFGFTKRLAVGLPREVGVTRIPTGEEWDAALDAVAAPLPFAKVEPDEPLDHSPDGLVSASPLKGRL